MQTTYKPLNRKKRDMNPPDRKLTLFGSLLF